MSHLLHVNRFPVRQRGGVPLAIEYAVPAETAPYLVSSYEAVLWVPEAFPGPVARAVVRAVSLGDFFQEVVAAIVDMGRQLQWGNVHPLTKEGLQAAIAHVASYGLEPLELLISRAHPPGSGSVETDPIPELMPPALRPILEDVTVPFRTTAWVPEGMVVVVPKDRTFVGVAWQVTPKKIAGIVHNAARGVGIAVGTGPAQADALREEA